MKHLPPSRRAHTVTAAEILRRSSVGDHGGCVIQSGAKDLSGRGTPR